MDGPADGPKTITKSSPNISYINHADLILVTANGTDTSGRKRQRLVAAKVDRDAFISAHETKMLGMRGILNAPWDFTVRFGNEAIFDEDFAVIARSTMTPAIQILWAALWSGIADHALGKARNFIATQLKPDDEATQFARHDLTRLISKHQMMNALISEALRGYEKGGQAVGFTQSARINRLKVTCSELLITICQGALQIIGLRGYVMGGPFTVAQPLADALSGPIMVSNYRLSLNTMKVENYVSEGI
ncbi:acyl-CoA dehydrogenase family protein [Pseudorhodobacter aquimaris]|uniref:acyl-CoA dehydrogenase family protein n=1 Tax=Pseudorhodobacter aquimaris TaxID=687412 RepID=UPI00067C7DF7|nr:acyl-CoA dehydrogenase family protein [Pseudorhodobacter aquimaris]